MPVIAAFMGILIRMHYREHGPPHFHAEHHGDQATFSFDGDLIGGAIRSSAARKHIRQWADLHRRELEANWYRARSGQPLERVEPLR